MKPRVELKIEGLEEAEELIDQVFLKLTEVANDLTALRAAAFRMGLQVKAGHMSPEAPGDGVLEDYYLSRSQEERDAHRAELEALRVERDALREERDVAVWDLRNVGKDFSLFCGTCKHFNDDRFCRECTGVGGGDLWEWRGVPDWWRAGRRYERDE